ncbi:MAG: hypothetical protein ABII90_12495 [Bacteroidota bacterium]
MLKKNTNHILAIISLFVLILIHLYKFHFFDFNSIQSYDVTNYYLPLFESLKISAIKYHNLIPLWNPFGFGGYPLFGSGVLSNDYLPGILLYVLPNAVAVVKMNFLLSLLLAGVSAYVLGLYLFKDWKYAIITSLAYTFSGYAMKHVSFSIAQINAYSLSPFIVLYMIKTFKEKDWIKNAIITGLLFALQIRAGPDLKVFLFMGILFGIYLIFQLISKNPKSQLVKVVMVSIIVSFVVAGLSMQRILPTEEYLKDTAKSDMTWKQSSSGNVKWSELFQEAVQKPNFGVRYKDVWNHNIGLIIFALGCFAIYKRWNNKFVLFLAVSALLAILIITASPVYYFLWKFIPPFNMFRRVDRAFSLFSLIFSILAGFGAKEFIETISKKYSLSKKAQNIAYFAIMALVLLNLTVFIRDPLAQFVFKYDDTTEPTYWEVYPINDMIEKNEILQYVHNQDGLFRIQNFEAVGIDWGTNFYNYPLELEHIYAFDSNWQPEYFNVFLGIANSAQAKFWGILNVKYVTSTQPINVSGLKFVKKFDECTVCPVGRHLIGNGPYLYENEKVMPRAYFAKNAILVVGDHDSIMQTMYALMLNENFDPSKTIIIHGKKSINEYSQDELSRYSSVFLTANSVDQSSSFILNQYVKKGKLFPDITQGKNTITNEDINGLFDINISSYVIIDDDINTVNFDKKTIKLNKELSEGFLVISERYSMFPGWNAYDENNNKQEILRSNGVISAIYLDSPAESITFDYKPRTYVIGTWLFYITAILLVAYFLYTHTPFLKRMIENDKEKMKKR